MEMDTGHFDGLGAGLIAMPECTARPEGDAKKILQNL
jgi:hypothetical protein